MSYDLQLKNAWVYWTKVSAPVQKFNTTQDKDKIYTVEVLLSKEDFKEFATKYPSKGKRAPVETSDFLEKYKSEVPEELAKQPLQYLIKLDVKAFKNDGTPMPDSLRPRVYEKNSEGVTVDITDQKIGNGSKAVINYIDWESDTPEGKIITPKLAAILVTNRVAFEEKRVNPHSFE